MNEIQRRIYETGIVPVIAIEDAGSAVPLARALAAGGIPAAEVTFRTEAGEDAIRQIAQNCPEVLVGAGTVLNVEQCDRAVSAGAKFIVSPGYSGALVEHCLERGITVFPGCANTSDMTRAVNAGLEAVKFFPAEQSGGLGFLKALAPVFPKLSFMPTGGINTKNLPEYLGHPRVTACGGTWMVQKDLIRGQRWAEITAVCKEAVQIMLGFSLRQVGINCAGDDQAMETARAVCAVFGFDCKDGDTSVFAGQAVECMKSPGYGKKGYIAIGTSNVDRAVFHLGLRGAAFDEGTRRLDAAGRIKTICFKEQLGGFALRLIQN